MDKIEFREKIKLMFRHLPWHTNQNWMHYLLDGQEGHRMYFDFKHRKQHTVFYNSKEQTIEIQKYPEILYPNDTGLVMRVSVEEWPNTDFNALAKELQKPIKRAKK